MKPLAAILLTLCLTAQADPSQRAQEAAATDVVTTGDPAESQKQGTKIRRYQQRKRAQ